jgi:hypothetical protein
MKQYYYMLKDFISGKPLVKRSSQWPRVRAEHLKNNPFCIVCGGKDKIEVHHIIPFSVAPHMELDKDNLATLCESKKQGINCHLYIGHCGDYHHSYGFFFAKRVRDANYVLSTMLYGIK